jgi:hypothetical protein
MTEQQLRDLRRGVLARQRVLMRVARATPISMSAANKNNDATERQLDRTEGAREGSSAVSPESDQRNEVTPWKLRTSPTSRY